MVIQALPSSIHKNMYSSLPFSYLPPSNSISNGVTLDSYNYVWMEVKGSLGRRGRGKKREVLIILSG